MQTIRARMTESAQGKAKASKKTQGIKEGDLKKTTGGLKVAENTTTSPFFSMKMPKTRLKKIFFNISQTQQMVLQTKRCDDYKTRMRAQLEAS